MSRDVTSSEERKQEKRPSRNDVLSVGDLARELRIGKNAAYRLAHRLPHARVGDLIRIRRSDLERELWGDPSNEEGAA
jgi:excisionase family DNA binding protein